MAGWTKQERTLFRKLSNPDKVQRFLDDLPYDSREIGIHSPRVMLRDGTANCMGALIAAAALREQGFAPLILYMTAVNDDGHCIAPFKYNGLWGAIAKSNYTTLRFREPTSRDLRELVNTYFDGYFNSAGQKTLRGYTQTVNLERFEHLGWRFCEEDLDFLDAAIDRARVYPIVGAHTQRKLSRVTAPVLAAGLVGANPAGLYKPK